MVYTIHYITTVSQFLYVEYIRYYIYGIYYTYQYVYTISIYCKWLCIAVGIYSGLYEFGVNNNGHETQLVI